MHQLKYTSLKGNGKKININMKMTEAITMFQRNEKEKPGSHEELKTLDCFLVIENPVISVFLNTSILAKSQHFFGLYAGPSTHH